MLLTIVRNGMRWVWYVLYLGDSRSAVSDGSANAVHSASEYGYGGRKHNCRHVAGPHQSRLDRLRRQHGSSVVDHRHGNRRSVVGLCTDVPDVGRRHYTVDGAAAHRHPGSSHPAAAAAGTIGPSVGGVTGWSHCIDGIISAAAGRLSAGPAIASRSRRRAGRGGVSTGRDDSRWHCRLCCQWRPDDYHRDRRRCSTSGILSWRFCSDS